VLEEDKKLSFEIKKNENPKLFSVSLEYLLFPVMSKLVWVLSGCFQNRQVSK